MAQGNAVFLEYAENKTGAVRTLGKAGASPDIRVTYELFCIFYQIYADIGYPLSVEKLCHGDGGIQLFFHCDIILGYISILAVNRNLHPAVGTGLHILHLFSLSHLSHDLTGGIGLLTYIQAIGIGNGYRMNQFHGSDSGFRSSQQEFLADITFHFTGLDMCPVIYGLDHFTGRILGKLTYQLTVCGRYRSHIQITGFHIGHTDIGIAPGSSLGILCDLDVFLQCTLRLQDRSHTAGCHEDTAFCSGSGKRCRQHTQCQAGGYDLYLFFSCMFYHKFFFKILLQIYYRIVTSQV